MRDDVFTEVAHSDRDRRRWLALRRNSIGASEWAAVLGDNPWRGPLAVYAAKVAPEPDEEGPEPERLAIGRAAEPFIASYYAAKSGREQVLDGRMLRRVDVPWITATLDARTWEGTEEPWPLELKFTAPRNIEHWADGIPRWNWWQAQAQMFVTGARRATVACMAGNERLLWDDVDYDEAAVEGYALPRLREFWRSVEERQAPAPGGGGSSDALRALYPKSRPGHVVELGAEGLAWAELLEEAKERRKRADDVVRDLEDKVRAAMGEAEVGTLPGGGKFTWKTQERGGYTVPPRSFRVLRYAAPKE